MRLVSFYIPWKHQKPPDLVVSGGIERNQRHKMVNVNVNAILHSNNTIRKIYPNDIVFLKLCTKNKQKEILIISKKMNFLKTFLCRTNIWEKINVSPWRHSEKKNFWKLSKTFVVRVDVVLQKMIYTIHNIL